MDVTMKASFDVSYSCGNLGDLIDSLTAIANKAGRDASIEIDYSEVVVEWTETI